MAAGGSYTTSAAFLEALAEAGVRYIFANLGSDHPGLIEAFARARAEGREQAFPRLVVCPHETVALSAAHAYAMVSGEPQAVIVHVDVGTQNLSGGVSNAMRGRVPVLIFAGMAPFTLPWPTRGIPWSSRPTWAGIRPRRHRARRTLRGGQCAAPAGLSLSPSVIVMRAHTAWMPPHAHTAT